jgi:two-component system, OmpR family, alkaline phosphatase synthesis response regulator PhoP
MKQGKKILVVEDEEEILDFISRYLTREHYEVLTCENGREACASVKKNNPDLLILDLMLPGMDGLEVIREVRKEHMIPIMVLSARGEEADRVIGLELGADDYMAKPFSPRELTARVKALLRRSQISYTTVKRTITSGRITLDLERRKGFIDEEELSLTPTEFALLKLFCTHPGRVFTREELLDTIWGNEFIGETRTVDMHIRNLRKKCEAEGGTAIRSVRGVGYLRE